jgi:NOL1/NOP2/sun family putative RNA methylase
VPSAGSPVVTSDREPHPNAHRLERYREVVPDWERFFAVQQTPEPVTLRVRRALIDAATLRGRLEEQGFRLAPIAGLDDYLRVESGPGSVAQTLEHWLGLFHVQQAVMALPSLALAPRPGDRVLDLCAAPGGKTAHLAELMEDRGPLVAVDPKEKRLRGLMANLFRLGHSNVIVVASDGRELPSGALFDRVLVDAPCSAEGNYRRQKGQLPGRTGGFQRYVSSLQEDLLRRAIELTRPGGVVVYSTCTFAPEENEAVVDALLRSTPVRLEPIALDLPHELGLAGWGDARFAPELEHAWRVYPHHLDSGGMFMARLRRLNDDGSDEGTPAQPPTQPSNAPPTQPPNAPSGPPPHASPAAALAPSSGWTRIPEAFPGEDETEACARIARIRKLLVDEYGFDPDFAGQLDFMTRSDNVWVQTAGTWPVDEWRSHGGWRVVAAGMRAFRAAPGGKETPSNQFLSRFQAHLGGARRRDLSDAELHTLLAGEPLDAGTLPTGPVALFREGILLGRGMVGRAGLRSEIPSAQGDRLREILR